MDEEVIDVIDLCSDAGSTASNEPVSAYDHEEKNKTPDRNLSGKKRPRSQSSTPNLNNPTPIKNIVNDDARDIGIITSKIPLRCNICKISFQQFRDNHVDLLILNDHIKLCEKEENENIEPILRHSYACLVCNQDLGVDASAMVDDSIVKSRIGHVKRCATFYGIDGLEDYDLFLKYDKPLIDNAILEENKENEIEILNLDDKEERKNQELLVNLQEKEEGYLGNLVEEIDKKNVNSFLMQSARDLVANKFKQISDAANHIKTRLSYSISTTSTTVVKKSPPRYKKIPNSEFVVDGFFYYTKKYYILTHFHSDHYCGLTKSTLLPSQIIICTPSTGRLLQLKMGIPTEQIQTIDYFQTIEVRNHLITCLDANHCPGSAMFLFYNLNTKKRTLHVGDFRYDNKNSKICLDVTSSRLIMNENQIQMFPLDYIYLDTTYCDPAYHFISQSEAVDSTIRLLKRYSGTSVQSKKKKLFMFGTYLIGKEKIFVNAINFLTDNEIHVWKKDNLIHHIFCSKDKVNVYKCLDFEAIDSKFYKKFIFTADPKETNFHIVSMSLMSLPSLAQYASSFQTKSKKSKYDGVIGVKATGWAKETAAEHETNLEKKCQATLISVPYSEHSSYTELNDFINDVRMKQRDLPEIIPTVETKPELLQQLFS